MKMVDPPQIRDSRYHDVEACPSIRVQFERLRARAMQKESLGEMEYAREQRKYNFGALMRIVRAEKQGKTQQGRERWRSRDNSESLTQKRDGARCGVIYLLQLRKSYAPFQSIYFLEIHRLILPALTNLLHIVGGQVRPPPVVATFLPHRPIFPLSYFPYFFFII